MWLFLNVCCWLQRLYFQKGIEGRVGGDRKWSDGLVMWHLFGSVSVPGERDCITVIYCTTEEIFIADITDYFSIAGTCYRSISVMFINFQVLCRHWLLIACTKLQNTPFFLHSTSFIPTVWPLTKWFLKTILDLRVIWHDSVGVNILGGNKRLSCKVMISLVKCFKQESLEIFVYAWVGIHHVFLLLFHTGYIILQTESSNH